VRAATGGVLGWRHSAKLRKWYDYPKYGCPFKEGDRYYYFHNSGLQPQSVLYTQKTLDSEGTVFLDPNTLSADGSVRPRPGLPARTTTLHPLS
jgi:prolyl oligopeptidase PreP (S9A serine peptidase family)